jgi:hypothetical protein
VPTLAKGLHVVVKPFNLRRSLLFKEITILAVPRGPCLRTPLLMAIKASLMFPAVPGRRFGATVPGPRRVVIKSGPTGSRRCPRCGTLLKRRSRVRSSWSRSGSFNGTPRPGVSHESYRAQKAISKARRSGSRIASRRTTSFCTIGCFCGHHMWVDMT